LQAKEKITKLHSICNLRIGPLSKSVTLLQA
jgi:hypothetical protein